MDNYSWGQSLQEVNITVPVPSGTKSRFITCEIKKNHLKVGLKGQPPVIDVSVGVSEQLTTNFCSSTQLDFMSLQGELCQSVRVDDCFWSLGGHSKILTYMHISLSLLF